MLDYLENPYILAISIVVGAVLVLLFYSFVSDGPAESGKKSSQRFVLPCMINPATLDTEDEDEDVPHEDLSKVKGEVNVENEPKVTQGDGPLNLVNTLEEKNDSDPGIINTSATEEDICIKASSVLEAEHMIKSSLSAQELQNERDIQRQQLAAIFDLMNKQSDKFGDMSLNDVQEQMRMYR